MQRPWRFLWLSTFPLSSLLSCPLILTTALATADARLYEAADALGASRPVPTCVLVALAEESGRAAANRVAAALRARGIPTEVSPSAAKFGRQIRFAERRGIPYVWFPRDSGDSAGGDEGKDIRSGEQVAADAATWDPPEADRRPTVFAR